MRAAHVLLTLALAVPVAVATACPRPTDCAGTCTPCNDEEGCPTSESCVEGRCQLAADAGLVQSEADAGRRADAGARVDGGFAADGGSTPSDAGADADGGEVVDGGAADAGTAADAGILVDAGTQLDAGAPDAGTAGDAGFAPDAGHLDPPWWDPAFRLRRPITVASGVGALAAGTPVRVVVDHAALLAQQQARADGADLRVVRWSDAGWIELPRVLALGTALGSPAAAFVFRLAADIPAQGQDDDTYLYFAAPNAGAPPLAGVPPATVVVQNRDDETFTDQTTPVTQSSLTFEAGAATDVWIVVATWGQHADDVGTSLRAGHARLLVDGAVVPGVSELSFRQASLVNKRMGTFAVVTGVAGTRAVELQIAGESAGQSAGIRASRLLAFLLPDPAASDVQVAETPALTVGNEGTTTASTLSFTPRSAGRYVWMVRGSHREGPGTSGGNLSAIDEDGFVAQSSNESYIDTDKIGYVPLFHVDVRDLAAAPVTLQVAHDVGSAAGAERQGILQVAFRADVFDTVEHAEDVVTTTTGAELKVALTTTDAPRAADRVVLGVVGHEQLMLDVTKTSTLDLEIDGVFDSEDVIRIDRASYETMFPIAFAERAAPGRRLEVYVNTEAGMGVAARFAHLVALRWREPVIDLGAVEPAP